MGSSPRADIFFGVYLGNEGSWHNDSGYADLPEWLPHDLDERIAEVAGIVRPTTPCNYDKPEWNAHYNACKAAQEACPVSIVHGGSHEFGTLDSSLAIKASATHANWDSNAMDMEDAPICKTSPGQRAEWALQLAEWAEKLGLPKDKIQQANPKGPRWLIVTSTG